MCFLVADIKSKIAKKDIICWKELGTDNSPFFQDSKPAYKKGKLNRKVLIKPKVISESTTIIEKGYHSWKTKNIAIYESWNYMKPNIQKFIIPAGTRYFENDTEYVSETIILQ